MAVPPAVALDLPAELSPELSGSTLRSCNLALGVGRCVLRDRAAAEQPEVAWVALLRSANEPEASVRIELRAAEGAEPAVAVRQLDFQVTDVPSQRWATAGVVVAALVVGVESKEVSTAEARARVEPSPAPPEPAPTAAPTSSAKPPQRHSGALLRLDLGVLGGPGFDQGPWRVGGQFRTSLSSAESPLVGWVSVTGSGRSAAVSAMWWSGAVGAGLRSSTQRSPLSLEGRVGAVGTRLDLSAGGSGGNAHAVRTRWGTVAAVDLVLEASRHWAAFVTIESTATWPRVVINARSERVGTEPTLEWALAGGARWVF
jgi:hypothetical protein